MRIDCGYLSVSCGLILKEIFSLLPRYFRSLQLGDLALPRGLHRRVPVCQRKLFLLMSPGDTVPVTWRSAAEAEIDFLSAKREPC